MANDSCCDRCQDASLPQAITQWPSYHAPIAESADPREIMDCHDALSITSPRTSTDTPSYPIKRTRRANHSSTVNPSPRVNPARARGRNQYPLNEMRQRCTILLAVVRRRASLKNLVTIRMENKSTVINKSQRKANATYSGRYAALNLAEKPRHSCIREYARIGFCLVISGPSPAAERGPRSSGPPAFRLQGGLPSLDTTRSRTDTRSKSTKN
ncbi:hypothetical protein G5I_13509 [Acromyrmex echinatior]|uniref:Uncharacterized protein n=1 Tax=Acromyrmex echinatior TaxID=103372 RepID=F4X584_ACREC|nr:hypothetical protein G5I_13509 [Acromyrmex echinatior]